MIKYSTYFLKEAKKLSKKYKFLKLDLQTAIKEIEDNNDMGVPLGFNLYKKRVKNSSIPTGKSGGFRIIVYTKVKDDIALLSIYTKTQKESLSEDELKMIVYDYLTGNPS